MDWSSNFYIIYSKIFLNERKNNMIEIAHMLFVYTPIELRVIILAGLIGGIYFIYKDGKNDKR